MMHEKLIAELEEMGKIAQNNRLMHWESIYLPQAAAALREDAGTIAEITETLAVRDRQISDMNVELTSLRAKLEKAEEAKAGISKAISHGMCLRQMSEKIERKYKAGISEGEYISIDANDSWEIVETFRALAALKEGE